MMILHG